MEELWGALGSGSKVLIEAIAATLVTVVSNPVFVFSLPAIYGLMYVLKQMTPFLRRSKYHDVTYTLMPLVFGVIYVECLKLFPGYFKFKLGHLQVIVLGVALGVVNILIYKGIKLWEKRKKKEEKKNG